jgi:hypothetical protein
MPLTSLFPDLVFDPSCMLMRTHAELRLLSAERAAVESQRELIEAMKQLQLENAKLTEKLHVCDTICIVTVTHQAANS